MVEIPLHAIYVNDRSFTSGFIVGLSGASAAALNPARNFLHKKIIFSHGFSAGEGRLPECRPRSKSETQFGQSALATYRSRRRPLICETVHARQAASVCILPSPDMQARVGEKKYY